MVSTEGGLDMLPLCVRELVWPLGDTKSNINTSAHRIKLSPLANYTNRATAICRRS
jgi:hypothetical protein